MMLRDTKERCDHRRMFELLKNFSKHRAMMTASIRNRDRAKHGTALLEMHSLAVCICVIFIFIHELAHSMTCSNSLSVFFSIILLHTFNDFC